MSEFQARGLRRDVGDRVLFDGLDFALAPGERLVLRAPSGAGKSLLLRGLAGLDRLEGEVTLDGRGLRAWGPAAWRARVLYVGQRPPDLPDTGAALWRRLSSLTCRATTCPLPDLGLPAGALERPWNELSGGERARALLGMALACDPEVLLLDEPTAYLDADASLRVRALLGDRRAVIATHDDGLAARLDARELRFGGAG